MVDTGRDFFVRVGVMVIGSCSRTLSWCILIEFVFFFTTILASVEVIFVKIAIVRIAIIIGIVVFFIVVLLLGFKRFDDNCWG